MRKERSGETLKAARLYQGCVVMNKNTPFDTVLPRTWSFYIARTAFTRHHTLWFLSGRGRRIREQRRVQARSSRYL